MKLTKVKDLSLPTGVLGRIAVSVAPSRPSTLYALVEAKKTALYRSEDLGESWTKMSASPSVTGRPFYFARILVDPKDSAPRRHVAEERVPVRDADGVNPGVPEVGVVDQHGKRHEPAVGPAHRGRPRGQA